MFKNNGIYKYLFVLLIFLIVIFLVFFILNSYISKSNYKSDKTNTLNISIYRIEKYINKNVSNREIVITNGKIKVGENKKQIENGYYDIEIFLKGKNIVINLNKLWKEFDEKLYQDEYILEVTKTIEEVLEITNKTEDIYEFIRNGYIMAKFNDDYSKEIKTNELNLGKYKFDSKVKNKQFVITIYLNK